MARMPDIEREAAEAAGWFRSLRNDLHQHGTQAPAVMPVNVRTTTTTEDRMSLSDTANAIKNAVENADQWVKEVTETHLPGLLAVAQKYENSPIVQALEGVMLPPALETEIAAMIGGLAARYPAQQAVQAQQAA